MNTERKSKSVLSRRDVLKIGGLSVSGLMWGGVIARVGRLVSFEALEKKTDLPLSIELAGESRSETHPEKNPWPYWRIFNPNSSAIAFRLELPERDENGKVVNIRVEEPANAQNHMDRFKQMAMVPANSDIVVFYPPFLGGKQEAWVSILDHNYLQNLGYSPSNEFQVTPKYVSETGILSLTYEATQDLKGKLIVQAQINLLNQERQVVQSIYTNSDEFNPLKAGEKSERSPISLKDRAPHSSYELRFLGLARS
ncbi:hypothetical protein A2V56_04070 [Candidatus Woesebacteria bacterium RBG_19FT_COMBO_42_9]|uniref:Uncharacterized protein n=1 Tax=Candidatus Woesebacteria bacterium RBG_16_42_24 TaxID=1802485 RepID=A0A1F7XJM3_9BACT|nr:MAG: hypothetical protein A2V97_01295 [Candidatus Woesebacteria bacterium RBG_16_42_24]OGM17796.1 MAG: hypothetical protein A2V56_04070 [Candidatus Woesebacteria bacterium RBG_19FT_COMBO_42_9]OGM68072.1 MAG: hypothetical protein A2985_03310 [Candidatus Woesebacteria bacterium RIFCSPLOWO2_01_FULL_43_11]